MSVEEVFEKRDANEDGKLSKDEVKGRLSKHFSIIDADGDGFITKEELKKTKENKKGKEKGRHGERGQRPSADELLTKMDANKDGKLSKDEVKGRLAEHFSKVDTDEDGFITKEELEKAPKPRRGIGKRHGKRN